MIFETTLLGLIFGAIIPSLIIGIFIGIELYKNAGK